MHGPTEKLWTTTGVSHLKEECRRHDSNCSYLDNIMKLSCFGRLSKVEQLDEGKRKHNKEVTKNPHILSTV